MANKSERTAEQYDKYRLEDDGGSGEIQNALEMASAVDGGLDMEKASICRTFESSWRSTNRLKSHFPVGHLKRPTFDTPTNNTTHIATKPCELAWK